MRREREAAELKAKELALAEWKRLEALKATETAEATKKREALEKAMKAKMEAARL